MTIAPMIVMLNETKIPPKIKKYFESKKGPRIGVLVVESKPSLVFINMLLMGGVQQRILFESTTIKILCR